MQELRARSLTELLRLAADARTRMDFRDGEECFFRGHAGAGWKLQPTLFRLSSFTARRPDDKLMLEYDLFYEFRARGRSIQNGGWSDWDVLFTMRHHGLPTRLLDWTESLGVALYFALEAYRTRAGEDDAALWMLNPYLLNESYGEAVRDVYAPELIGPDPSQPLGYERVLLSEVPRFGWDVPVAIYPHQREERMHSQRGWFTIHGDRQEPLEELVNPEQLVGNGGSQCVLAKIVIDSQALPDVQEHLNSMGITTFLLFPDLDGLSRDLIEKYRIRT